MIRGLIAQVSIRIDMEQTYLGAAGLISVSNHDDRVLGNKHFVIPGAARINERVHAGDGSEVVAADSNRKQSTTVQHDKMIAVKLDDSSLVDAGVLDIRDGFVRITRNSAWGCGLRSWSRETQNGRCRTRDSAFLFLGKVLKIGP